MPLTSAGELLEVIRRLRLLPDALADELAVQPELPTESADALADLLVHRALLTSFQARLLLAGRGAELLLGPYLLLDKLGAGGMGQVFKVRHRGLDQLHALKVLRPGLLGDANAVSRLRREAQAAARLNHPNIVRLIGWDAVGPLHFLAMEYLQGTDLGKLVEEGGPLAVPLACEYIRQAALGLQHIYECGIVHRDIKPSNLFVTQPGEVVKILDLGLVRMDRLRKGDGESVTLTQLGQLVGTVDYLAPEQALDARDVDIRADIYSLGCTLYCLLTGQPPYAAALPMQKFLCHQLGHPVPIQELRPELPAGLAEIVGKMMAPKPADRYAVPAEVAAALEPYTHEGTVTTDVTALLPDQEAEREAVTEIDSAAGPDSWRPRRRWPRAVAGIAASIVGLSLGLSFGISSQPEPARRPPSEGMLQQRPLATVDLPPQITNSLGMTLVLIRPHSFWMGSPPDEPGRDPKNERQHLVRLSRPYYLGATEVTREQLYAILGEPSNRPAEAERNLPATEVSWTMAHEFCRRLSQRPEEQQHGRLYRLPTEAEWEAACRAGRTSAYGVGDRLSREWANFDSEQVVPVASYPANDWGLFDMHGNVWEWCADWYRADYYHVAPVTDPPGPDPQRLRVRRGGGFSSKAEVCRSACRGASHPEERREFTGFRVAMTPLLTNP